jgi:hypothetical protein
MPDNRYDLSQSPAPRATPLQENIHTTSTVTTDRTLQAPSVAQLQDLEQSSRRLDFGYGF